MRGVERVVVRLAGSLVEVTWHAPSKGRRLDTERRTFWQKEQVESVCEAQEKFAWRWWELDVV